MNGLVTQIIDLLLGMMSKEQGKEILDGLFDKIENKVAETPNQWDDALVLPLINKARAILDVPDNDD